ncbi:helix-turn-helix domain-containing protein [Cyanobium sp. Aljojuca 7A6]|nr:helix-turn-helix domain-containing protein [Cyanobium sp. La Preciosa 7G6]MCP9936830.1 helix-turn-helix domain-containing protein [Cyanobium sp. Aljojuca 7A6]
MAEIARDTGITAQTIYNWRSQWQKQGQLVPASTKPPEQWSAADKLAAVIQAAGLSGTELGTFSRERGLYPKQVARWRQTSEDANGPSAPSMADQRELQRKNQEQAREIRRLQRELDKKDKALTKAATLL